MYHSGYSWQRCCEESDSGKALRSSLWWGEGFTLRVIIHFKTKRHPGLFVFWHNCFTRPYYHWNLSWFPTKCTDLRCLHSKSDCHLCCCFHNHISSGLFLNTMIWSYPQNMQYCTQASTLEKINYYTCMHKLSSFSFDDNHTADCIYKADWAFKNIKALRGLHCLTDTD